MAHAEQAPEPEHVFLAFLISARHIEYRRQQFNALEFTLEDTPQNIRLSLNQWAGGARFRAPGHRSGPHMRHQDIIGPLTQQVHHKAMRHVEGVAEGGIAPFYALTIEAVGEDYAEAEISQESVIERIEAIRHERLADAHGPAPRFGGDKGSVIQKLLPQSHQIEGCRVVLFMKTLVIVFITGPAEGVNPTINLDARYGAFAVTAILAAGTLEHRAILHLARSQLDQVKFARRE